MKDKEPIVWNVDGKIETFQEDEFKAIIRGKDSPVQDFWKIVERESRKESNTG